MTMALSITQKHKILFINDRLTKRSQRSVDLDYRCCMLTVDKVCNHCQR